MSAFPRLAAALKLEELDDERAATAVEQLRLNQLAAEQEREVLRTELAQVTSERDELRANGATLIAERIELAIEGAYRSGRLTYRRDADGNPLPSDREKRLRRLAAQSWEEFETELGEMPVIVPINKRVLKDDGESRQHGDTKQAIKNAAEQLGLDPERIEDY